MPLQSIEHFLILAKDLEETMAFYRDVLGLQVGERPPFPFPGCWMYLESIPCVHIAEAAATEGQSAYLGENRSQSNGTGPIDHIGFVGTDMHAFIERLDTLRLPFTRRKVPEAGFEQIFIEDPNGIRIEVNFSASDILDTQKDR